MVLSRTLVLKLVDHNSAVKYQMKLHGDDLKEGDVIMTNSPHAGGSQVPFGSPAPLFITARFVADISRTSP